MRASMVGLGLFMWSSGCATFGPTPDAASTCGIQLPVWSVAHSDFDRAATLEVLASLKDTASEDREHARLGRRDEVGRSADALFTVAPSAAGAFVSYGAYELASRLRQLDCAVRRSSVTPELAQARYGAILAELDAERTTLGAPPKGLSSR
jgi:hypothetical protein